MSFTLYPAIDLRGGHCVRLFQGDFDRETVYGEDPVQVARRWEEEGAGWLHVVDLDAAKTGDHVNLSAVRDIIRSASIPIQVGGGVRDLKRLENLLSLGAARVVIGSAAIDDPEFVKEALRRFGDRIAIGLDAQDGWVATHGWLETSEVRVEDLGREMAAHGAETFIFTDISRDGTLTGPNIAAVRALAEATGKGVIASGGVGNTAHLTTLVRLAPLGVTGAIVGKALYTGALDIKAGLLAIEEGTR
ncbi:1-(5-phosphoribosyl)-5-[(5-phosphoribosylamino) methylideneamino] imidazole-4-carboxamide isomerase [Kroppenstedtia guangzhouensis]|uniref:1-(5-phosphoribosyl)-5-[(5-phosphoribosylamino)methylideneamino] imidazole-4-carboxamide isomerase n=1 Tax=Kroppenstedtia guangzhouensis TaxID=1274356 RepID=A0ABQ1GJN5_9BACL|nr:1-(5-phosphoribosyl)-5-[(5-phosphoribosylamino)methylideneamino]imidazole-4-carboxamide isomerase [Kroppenstedtia guangzhouensis]GGA44944.1 1-(5-phosphoribosyl)-5-[(5-phosphoribosylamino) methylideneamino] imidazole-4-carboxamide isomerase [Kroppenstedtia guangzhouensis]